MLSNNSNFISEGKIMFNHHEIDPGDSRLQVIGIRRAKSQKVIGDREGWTVGRGGVDCGERRGGADTTHTTRDMRTHSDTVSTVYCGTCSRKLTSVQHPGGGKQNQEGVKDGKVTLKFCHGNISQNKRWDKGSGVQLRPVY